MRKNSALVILACAFLTSCSIPSQLSSGITNNQSSDGLSSMPSSEGSSDKDGLSPSVSTPTTPAFNSENYRLEIAAKSEYVPSSSESGKKSTKQVAKVNDGLVTEGSYTWSGDALVINTDNEDIQELEALDPAIGPDSEPRVNGRLLTAPSDATLVEVTGINLLDGSEVIAPQQWQLIEADDNGLYLSNTLDLSAKYEGVIQPRSIKTTNLTLESGFSIDRKNVYFINGENNHFVTSETAYENFASYKIDAENLRRQIVDTIN